VSRWQHESSRGADLALPGELVAVLGRIATRSGQAFAEGDVQDAAEVDAVDAASVLQSAMQLGFVRPAGERGFAFFHPSFAEYYATVHCRRHLGDESPDGWDERLFNRIAQLGDPSFIPRLVAMAGGGFWRGEYCDEIAMTLNSIGNRDDPEVVSALLHLAGYHGLRMSGMLLIVITAGRAVNTTARRVPAHIPSAGTLEQERRYVLSPAPLILAAGDRQDLTAATGQSPRTSVPGSRRASLAAGAIRLFRWHRRLISSAYLCANCTWLSRPSGDVLLHRWRPGDRELFSYPTGMLRDAHP